MGPDVFLCTKGMYAKFLVWLFTAMSILGVKLNNFNIPVTLKTSLLALIFHIFKCHSSLNLAINPLEEVKFHKICISF